MKIVMTLVVRDEAEILADQLDYHLAAGVDFVIATDHRSRDGTREILERYEQRGVVRLLREEDERVSQGAWQTRMARLAALEHDADWVIASDADEFWWPLGGSLRRTLASIPPEYGVVRASMLNFVPLRNDDGWFADRMTIRLALPAPIHDPATPYRPVVKVAHRADPAAQTSEGGGHGVSGVPGALLDAWHPLDLLHFPIRSEEQCARKYRKTWTGWETNLRGDLQRARAGVARGREDTIWQRVALGEREIQRGVSEGTLVVDARVRDALREVRGAEGREAAKDATAALSWPEHRSALVFGEAELVRRARTVDELQARVSRLESDGVAGAVRPRRFAAR